MKNNLYFNLYRMWKSNRPHPIEASVKHVPKNAEYFWKSKQEGTYYANGARGSIIESWHKSAREKK